VHGIHGADRDDVFVNVISVHVMEMAIMKIVNLQRRGETALAKVTLNRHTTGWAPAKFGISPMCSLGFLASFPIR
jgi:hypothetical protein